MEISKENLTNHFVELDIGNSTESFQKFLESQKDLFHSQIDQLQKIVITQCKLTGVNPLSQEMAAGSLSINIGKRPRDLLNPKAVKYMQSVFSIKDTISKKESREISALCGVTVTQVREFFAGQRSRVRKLVRLSREKAIKSDTCKISQDGCSTSSDPALPIIDQVPLNSVDPKTIEEAPSCSTQEETIPGIDDFDKNFLENIFNLMRKEETFSGQVKLMEWILQIQNSSVLHWFLTKGGVMILAAWLSQAALEEQTTVLLVIFKVLCHLPLHKALPLQMSAILQTVNRLRFYRTSDISNRAKVLLSRWSKLFVRNQALQKPSSTKSPSDAQKEIFRKQRIGEILSNESWQSKIDIPEEILALTYESSENCRKLEPPQALKLLPASTDDSNKKNIRSVSSTQTRERRKVLLMEQPGWKTTGRSLQVAKAVPSNQGRPMSNDDIQKAKMRAVFMKSKYGKTGASSNASHQQKTEDPSKFSAPQSNHLLSASKTPVGPKIEVDKKPTVIALDTSTTMPEAPMDSNLSSVLKEPSWEKLKSDRISWKTPPEFRINCLWRVGAGEKSKEIEGQTGRIRREKETIYQRIQDIPSDPKDPWDVEMDYDDTLTPEIPTEQPPDADGAGTSSSPRHAEKPASTSAGTLASISSENAPEPDLELLAVLLKNPELVFALTSGQGSITSEDTVKLLDMIKASGLGLPGILNGLGGSGEMGVTSLPSPTPHSESIMNGWRSEVAKVPVSATNRDATVFPAAAPSIPSTGLVQPQTLTTNFALPQLPTSITLAPQHPSINLPAASQERQRPSSPQDNSSFFGQMHNIKPAPVSIVLNHPKDRPLPITLPSMPPLLPTPARPQPPLLPEPAVLQSPYPTWQWNPVGTGKQSPASDSRSGRPNGFEGSASNTYSQANQNNYEFYPGGPAQPPLIPRPPWERNEFVGEPEFEMWSPERSPERTPEYRSGRNFSDSRRDYGRNSRPDWSRQRNSGHREHRHGNRRWRDRRR